MSSRREATCHPSQLSVRSGGTIYSTAQPGFVPDIPRLSRGELDGYSTEAMCDFDPDHPIIDAPHEFEIATFHYETPFSGGEAYIDLHLLRGGERRRLRFICPQQLRIEEGFPAPTHGMRIKDVSSRGLDGLNVQVVDVEASWGAMTFWARDVFDLDESE